MFKPVDKEKFETFISQVEANGVSSADVISFENLIGSNFITKYTNTNRFSSERSRINADSVIARAKEAMDSIDTESTKYTVLDVCNISVKVTRRLEDIMSKIKCLVAAINSEKNAEVIERMFNEKYTLCYKEDNLLNVADDENIIQAFRWNRNYLQALVSDKHSVNNILDMTEDISRETTFIDYSPLFNVLNGNGFGYIFSNTTIDSTYTFKLTIRNLINFLYQYESSHEDKLKWTLNTINDIKHSYFKQQRVFDVYDYRVITTAYTNLEIIDNLLNDKLGNTVIDILRQILKD